METIEHNGQTFVKATALAKKHRYTTDYIGQLCRSGKVEAKLIGRAWFVNEKSLFSHKSERYNPVRSSEITINKSLVSDRQANPVAVRREIRQVLSKSTHRAITQANPGTTFNFETKGANRVSIYHSDIDQLEPPIIHKATLPFRRDNDQESHIIKVSLGDKASRKLAFEELPEVALRGNLKIDSLDAPELFAEVEPVAPQSIQFAPKSVSKPSVLVTKRYQPRQPSSPVKTEEYVSEHELAADTKLEPETKEVNFAPARHIPTAPLVKESIVIERVSFVVVPVLVSVSLVLSGLLLGLTSYAETDGLQFSQSLSFSVAAAVESVAKLPESY